MKSIQSTFIYDNPLPQLRSRHAAFPFICELADGRLLSTYTLGEAFESIDYTSHISVSNDKGKTWSAPRRMFDKSGEEVPITDCCKLTRVGEHKIVALGYAFWRPDPDLPLANPETGGLLDDFIFFSISEDDGETWSNWTEIPCVWGHHVEASAPITVLADGSWATPITGFDDWEGNATAKKVGRILRSYDEGKTWNDDVICMDFGTDDITCFEQRLCQLENGTIVVISWNENVKTGERYNNHYSISTDNGKTFSKPLDTGILAQASGVCSIGGNRLIATHAFRRDTDEPGIYGFLVDLSDGKWNIVDKALLWKPATPMIKETNMAEIFSFLKFGQPGAVHLSDGTVLMSHWCSENGQYKTVCTEIEL
ncbi:MAG: exo-alpha-sialidase [Oscillospiraceae bacterium]|nr:exo-alpha-sialidase [Oscillospiraceae bacterium]